MSDVRKSPVTATPWCRHAPIHRIKVGGQLGCVRCGGAARQSKRPLSIFRLEDFHGLRLDGTTRTAIVVATSATNARKAAMAEAVRLCHREPEIWSRSARPKEGLRGTLALRIAVASPLGGLHRPGEILRLDDGGPR